MDTGPECYRNRESEEMELVRSFRIRTIFPKDVGEEVVDLPENPAESDFAGREDLRGETIFTIDGDDAKDFDDAISIEPREGGGYTVGVHIADVGHYVQADTALGGEALARGTSVYLPDQVIPMLPEGLSNGLCSLRPDVERLAFTVIMDFDEAGIREATKVHKSVIKSVKRCTYRAVQGLLDHDDTEEAKALEFLRVPLEHFQVWTKRQQAIRDAKGSLRIQSTERKFVFDENHEVCDIVDAPRYFSQTLIEETALAANQAVGDYFRERGLPTIYRVHPEKDWEEIERVAKMLEEHGIRVPDKERLTGRDVGRLIRAARRRPNAEALIGRIMGLVERAVYEVKDHEDVAKHFGLAREAYLHFTSPIRRYPDLMVHRWLWALISRTEEAEAELRGANIVDELNEVAAHASLQAEVAKMAETAIGDLKVCQYMEPQIDKKLEARVVRVSRGGLEVRLDDFNVTGFLPVRSMGERPKVQGSTLTLRAGKRVLSFTEGYPITVLLKDVDFIRLQVLFVLA
jgi:ribonuclease R